MPVRNTDTAWGSVSIGLHWLVVLLVLVGATIGLVMDEMPNSVAKIQVFALHKSLGLTVLALMLLRLAWRLVGGRPAALAGTARWQSATATITHWLLYAALVAMPLSGWLYNSASNFPLRWFGLVRVPPLSGRDPDLKEFAHEAHETIFWIIIALVLLHVGAALWHHLVRRDATLDRMLPARLRRRPAGASMEERQ